MNVELFATWVLVGILTGGLAGLLVKGGGHGRFWDVLLALGGSSAASGIFWFLNGSPDASKLAMAVVAFVGAAAAILAQRKLWYVHT